jgi:hypothetical protein
VSQFRVNFARIIQDGLKKNASSMLARQARKKIKDLKMLYKPHVMRRLKREMFNIVSAEMRPISLLKRELPLKTDLVIWIPLSDA